MKKITKVLSIALAILFIAIPVLQIITGKGMVHAENIPERSIYGEASFDDDDMLRADAEKMLVKGKEVIQYQQYKLYKYRINCESDFSIEGIDSYNRAKELFIDNQNFSGIVIGDTSLTKSEVIISVCQVKISKQKNGKYKVTGIVNGSFLTDYIQKRDHFTGGIGMAAKITIDKEGNYRSLCASIWQDASGVYGAELKKVRAYYMVKNIANQPVTDRNEYYKSMYDEQNHSDQTPQNTYTYTDNQGGTATTYTPNVTGYNEVRIDPPPAVRYVYVNIHQDGRKLFIRHLYKSVQNRAPAPEDYVNYMQRSVQTNAIDVIMSKEADEKKHVSQMSNEDFVRLVYKAVLSRDPDATGLNDYTAFLNNGIPRTAVIKEICESPEFRERWNRPVKTLTFDTNTCTAVLDYLAAQPGVEIIKPSSTTLRMYSDDVDKVKELNISTKNLTNLNGISQFPNLETLTAMNNNYTNISELSKLKNVKTLNLDNCNLKTLDLTPIKSMTNLQYLHLESNGLTDRMLTFAGMPSIKKLYLKNNEIVTISSTMLTDNLIGLNLENNQVMNTSYVDGSKLQAISVRNNKNGLNSRGTKKIIPEIVKDAQNQSSMLYATNGIVFNKCKIVGNSLVMDDGAATATVTIKGGAANGTVITLKNIDIAQ